MPSGSTLWTLLLLGLVFCGLDGVYLFYRIHLLSPTTSTTTILEDATTKKSKQHVRHDKEPLIEILRQSGMKESDITDNVVERLPTWSTVTSLMGTHPRIHGLDTCPSFRSSIPPAESFVAPAGAFNSGTNLMAELLIANCINPHRVAKYGVGNNGVRWQVNWGKHQPPSHRLDHSVNQDGQVPNQNILPVVLVRDPYTWMQSLCRNRYATHWFHVVPLHCPNLIPNHVEREFLPQAPTYKQRRTDLHHNDPWLIDNVVNTANYTLDSKTVPVYVKYKKETTNHDSLAHMWNDWYHAYFYNDDNNNNGSSFPRLMVRFEDLLFFGKNVTEQVCACMGGRIHPRGFVHVAQSAKKGKIHQDKSTLVDVLVRYGGGARYDADKSKGMTAEDLDFAKASLDPHMMQVFGYQHPTIPQQQQ